MPTRLARLALFISTIPAQRRWVFKSNDAKVLAQIDSVYVTLEPTAKAGEKPERSENPDRFSRYASKSSLKLYGQRVTRDESAVAHCVLME